MQSKRRQAAELVEMLSRLRTRVRLMTARVESATVALSDATGMLDQFTAVYRRIAELHGPHDVGLGRFCVTCDDPWPCATALALGEVEELPERPEL